MYTLKVPLRVPTSSKRWFALNLNQYRNAHFHVLNKAKIVFKELIKTNIETLPIFERAELTFILYPKTKRLCDLDNVLSIVNKFTADALVELGKLPEDNYLYIPKITYEFGSVNKEDPHCLVIIKELK